MGFWKPMGSSDNFCSVLFSFKHRPDMHFDFLLSKNHVSYRADAVVEAVRVSKQLGVSTASVSEAAPALGLHLLMSCPSFSLRRGPCNLPFIAPVVKVCGCVSVCGSVCERERQRESLRRVDMKKRRSERSWQCDMFYSVQVSVIFRPDKVSHESSRGREADSRRRRRRRLMEKEANKKILHKSILSRIRLLQRALRTAVKNK